MNEINYFLPDWVSPPGETISDILDERGLSVTEFAKDLGNSSDYARQLLSGYIQITEEVASKLANLFGISAGFWLSRESQFRDGLARLAKNEEWLKELPVNDLINFKWIRNSVSTKDKISACLDFFGVATVTDWRAHYEGFARLAAFRTTESFSSSEAAVLTWLRKGEIDSDIIKCSDWDSEKFRSVLPSIRALTRQKDPSVFIPELQKLCAECGVAVVIARSPSGCRASGATRFISNNKALLMLSFRYLSDDHFWFTFFHEVGHLLLHDTTTLFLEGGDLCSGNEEQEADEFSSNFLITLEDQTALKALPVDGRAVMRFAKQIGISPGIVVGQLQHLGIFTHRQLNNLKVRYRWIEE